ncbi:hypothetical protein G6F65_022198 [Rhizopus arrhizus]|nr:hypothetical protein G6F65_022198 [Rhizopus arrhizus]
MRRPLLQLIAADVMHDPAPGLQRQRRFGDAGLIQLGRGAGVGRLDYGASEEVAARRCRGAGCADPGRALELAGVSGGGQAQAERAGDEDAMDHGRSPCMAGLPCPEHRAQHAGADIE